jgi:hypothetical protein
MRRALARATSSASTGERRRGSGALTGTAEQEGGNPMRLTRSTTIVLAIAALAMAGAAIAYATGTVSGGSGGVVLACANDGNGNLRALDPQSQRPSLQACKPDETPLGWSVAGGGGVSGYEVVTAASQVVGSDGIAVGTATCPAGKKPLGGGMSYVRGAVPTGYYWTVVESYPDGSGWTVAAAENFAPGIGFTVHAVCVSA